MDRPAFPHPSGAQGCDGMSYREWLAGQALQGLLAANARMTAPNADEVLANAAILIADALIDELDRTK